MTSLTSGGLVKFSVAIDPMLLEQVERIARGRRSTRNSAFNYLVERGIQIEEAEQAELERLRAAAAKKASSDLRPSTGQAGAKRRNAHHGVATSASGTSTIFLEPRMFPTMKFVVGGEDINRAGGGQKEAISELDDRDFNEGGEGR